ncbi:MAG: ribonuclease HII [Pseudomonadota bacterium]
MPDLSLETACGHAPVCGVDEVGRGPWAGPVVAAAVILPPGLTIEGLNDSKALSRTQRERLSLVILAHAQVGLGEASVAEIDQINILQASLLAMDRAVAALPTRPAFALVDGRQVPAGLPCPGQGVIKGDARSASIAAASIVAKVTRDAAMVALSQQFPGYGWETNAGYGVPAHIAALKRLGLTPHHRRSFAPIHKMLI